MKRVTDDERDRMKHWVSNLMPGSTTNYARAFEAAFEVLNSSPNPTGCANDTALVFLTDGRPDDGTWSDANLARVRQLNEGPDAAILTFTLGDDIDPSVTSQLACENYGVYKHVSQVGELDAAMASYYRYFATKYQPCEGSLRFLEYTDTVTCERLLAGCMPVFDGDDLFGVTCMDANVIATLGDLQAQAGWAAFESAYTQTTRECGSGARPDLAAMRLEAEANNAAQGVTATCAATTTAVAAGTPYGMCTKVNAMSPFQAYTCTPQVHPPLSPPSPPTPPPPPSPPPLSSPPPCAPSPSPPSSPVGDEVSSGEANQETESSGMSGGVVAGIAIGVLAGVGLAAAIGGKHYWKAIYIAYQNTVKDAKKAVELNTSTTNDGQQEKV